VCDQLRRYSHALHPWSVGGLGPLVQVGALAGSLEGVGLGRGRHGVGWGGRWGGGSSGLEGVGLGLRSDGLALAPLSFEVLQKISSVRVEVLVVAAVLGPGGLAAAAAEVEAAATAAAAAVAEGGQPAEQEQGLAPSRVNQEVGINIFFTELLSNCQPQGTICIINITLGLVT